MSSEDRAALVALFRSTGGTRWKRNDNWDTDADLSQWRGVQVNDDGRVVKLKLSYNNLEGTVPEALGALTELKELNLYGNELKGPIPEALEALNELTNLKLGWNKITGSIPSSLGSLRKLQTLWLNINHLAGPIPEALGALKELRDLWLNDNKLTGHIPKELGNLENLQSLTVENTQLTGAIPTELGNLSNLTTFRLGNNRPKSIWRRGNKLSGVIPRELGNLSALSTFEFGTSGLKAFMGRGNKLSGGPAEGEGLDSWRERIRPKQATKWLTLKPPPQFAMASEGRGALVALFRSTGGTRWNQNDNWDTDADLTRWYGVQVNEDGHVVELRLSRNNLEGTIPEAVGALTKLKVVHMGGNKLTGPISEALEALKDLEILNLGGNKLTGCVPAWLGSLKKLQKLGLNSNQLGGRIPEALGALEDLTILLLSHNNLTGPISEALEALKDLEILNLGGNKLTGCVPAWLGSLKKLQKLGLNSNQLGGRIPEALGALEDLTILLLSHNNLTGPVPEALGVVKELRDLCLNHNMLTGSIPTRLGSLSKLRQLRLNNNLLVGHVPEELGNLKNLVKLHLQNNLVTGGPAEGEGLDSWRARIRLEQRTKPQTLKGDKKEEDAPVPPSSPPPVLLPQQQEEEEGDKTTGTPVPSPSPPPVLLPQQQEEGEGDEKQEDYQVPTASIFPVLLPQQQETGEGEQKADAPVPSPFRPPVSPQEQQETGEGGEKQEDAQVRTVSTPPALLPQQQQEGEGDENEDAPVLLDSPNQRQEVVGGRVRSPEHASLSPGKTEEVDRLFRAQLSSSAGLHSLIRENPEALEDIQRIIAATTARSIYPHDEFSDMDGRWKLGTLVTMSNALGEVALRHTEDMDVQRKELALAPFSKAYYSAVRSGLCNAYLAASVIDSDWVSTSKTGGMGKAGAALQLMSSAAPVVGGLAGLAGKGLETGDHYLQTRQLVKITAMAPDAVECCALARRLALQLTDGLRDDASTTADNADVVRVDTTAAMNGGSGCGRGADMMPGDMNEEDVFEYVLEEVASYERNDHGGKRLGKQHLRKLLKAIQRGCLDGSNGTEQKIEVLLLEILPEADVQSAATSSTPKGVIVRRPPVLAPAHDSGLPSRADFAAMQAELAALKFAKDKQQAELEEQQEKIEAVESDKATQQAELAALKSAKDKQQAELKEQQEKLEAVESDKEKQKAQLEKLASAKDELERKVQKLEKHVSELDSEPDDDVDFAGGLALRRRVAVTETAEGFFDRARDRAARAGDHHPVTVAEQREYEALQNEKHREHEARFRELEGEIRKATKRKGRR